MGGTPCHPQAAGASSEKVHLLQDGGTALMFASKDGYVDVVELLLKQGAVVDAKQKVRATVL